MRRYCHIVANGRSRYVQWKCWPCIVFAGAPIIRFVGAVHKVAGRISGLRRYRQLSPPHKHTLKPGFLRFFSTRKIPPTAHGKNLTDLTMMMAIPRCWISRAVKHRTCAVPFSPCNRERQNLLRYCLMTVTPVRTVSYDRLARGVANIRTTLPRYKKRDQQQKKSCP